MQRMGSSGGKEGFEEANSFNTLGNSSPLLWRGSVTRGLAQRRAVEGHTPASAGLTADIFARRRATSTPQWLGKEPES